MVRRNDAVEICKTVSALEAGKRLGLEPNHDGRCACPVHNGHDRNCKLYDGDRGFYCFVCHERGDVIRLVELVLNCTFTEAVQWLSDEFHLGIDIDKPVDREALRRAKKRARTRKELEARIRKHDSQVYDRYLDAVAFLNRIDRIVLDSAPKREDEEWSDLFCKALQVRTEAKEIVERYQDLVMK